MATATGCGWDDDDARLDPDDPLVRLGDLVAKTMESKPPLRERMEAALKGLPDSIQGSQAWNSIFRPG